MANRPGRSARGAALLGLLALAAPCQDPPALVQRLYGREPGEWAKGLLVQLRLDDHPALLHFYLAATGEARLQTELPEGRIWDVAGPEGAWRCQPREAWPLQGKALVRLQVLKRALGLLALWPLLEGPPAAGPEGSFVLADGSRLEIGLDSQGWPCRFKLKEAEGPILQVEAIGPRRGRSTAGPAWPESLEIRQASLLMQVRLESLRPFSFLDPGFFKPRRGLRVHGRLLPESLPLDRLLLGQEAPEQAVVLAATGSPLEQTNVVLLIGEALVAAGFTLSRLPAFVHEPEGWRILLPFAGEGPVPTGLLRRDLPGGTYARLYLEGPWNETALKGVPRLERLLKARGLVPIGPVQIVPFRRPGLLLMPFEVEERVTELRVRVEA